MDVSEIGTKLTESTLVLHLQNIDIKPISPGWLQDKLGLRVDEQWTALNSPGNEAILAALYEEKRAGWNGKILRFLPDGSFDELAIAPASELTPEMQGDLLEEGRRAYSEAFATWPLPKQDFIVPFSGTLLGQMCGLTRGESASYATISAEPFVFPQDALTELVERVEALRRAIAARERRWRDNAKSLAAYRRVDGMLQLLERAYQHAAKRPHDREEAEARAGQVAGLRAELDDAFARVAKKAVGDEEALADAVLEAMDNGDLADAAEKIAFDPLSVDADAAEELVTTVRYACEHLSRSVRADVLLCEHVWPAIGVAAANAPYGFDVLLDEVNSPELRAELESGWAKTYEEIRAHLGAAKKEGLVAKLSKAGKYYRAARP